MEYSHFYDAKVQAELASSLEIPDYELCYATDNVKIQGNMSKLRCTEPLLPLLITVKNVSLKMAAQNLEYVFTHSLNTTPQNLLKNPTLPRYSPICIKTVHY